MTKDQIMAMAQQARPLIQTPLDDWCVAFAALVAAKEREECAEICEELSEDFWMSSPAHDAATRCMDTIRARRKQR